MKQLCVLLVEDNPGDQRLVKEALRENDLQCELHIAEDGVQALQFLRREGKYQDAPRPDLILLDLNLPKISGREVLGELKAEEGLKSIPVVVMTTSQADEDISKVYGLNGNCFVTKPVDLDEFLHLIDVIGTFWFSVARLPSGGRP